MRYMLTLMVKVQNENVMNGSGHLSMNKTLTIIGRWIGSTKQELEEPPRFLEGLAKLMKRKKPWEDNK